MEIRGCVPRFVLVPGLLLVLSAPAWAQDAAKEGPLRGDGKAVLSRAHPGIPGELLQPRVGDERDADTDVLHYFLDIELSPETQWLGGSNTMTVRSLIDNLTTFHFRLDSILDITEMRIGQTAVSWTHIDNPTVEVTLDRAYQADEQFDLYVAYSGHPHAGGWGSIQFGFRPPGVWSAFTVSQPWFAYTWWPAKDDLRDKTTADFWITVHPNMIVASNGALQGVDDLGLGRSRYRWRTVYETDDYLYCFGATNYTEFGTTWEYQDRQMPLQFYILPESDTPGHRAKWLATSQMLTTYSDLFGIYPFVDEKYGMLEWFDWMGMEHQTMTSILGGDMGFEWESGIAHELAHQWWGDNVTCATWHDVWLNEGFGDYCEALWWQYKPGSSGEPALHAAMAGELRPDNVDGTVYCYDISDVDRIFDYDLSYRKAGWVLHMLRHVVGDETFFAMLGEYRHAFEGGTATTADFQSVAEAVSGRDLDWFIDEWIYAGGAPAYEYAWQQVVLDGRRYLELYLEQIQSEEHPIFSMPIDIQVNQLGGMRHVIWNDARAEHLLFEVGAQLISGIVFDPTPWILRTSATATTFREGPPKIVTAYPAPDDTLEVSQVSALEIVFHKSIVVDVSDFSVIGQGTGAVPVSFAYDSFRHAVTLTPQSPLAADTYVLTVSDEIRDVASNQALDGEVINPRPHALPSGDGLPGGSAVVVFTITDEQGSSIGEGQLALRTGLRGASPSPFSGRTDISFELERASYACVSIFDPSGRRLRTLVDANLPAGAWRLTWDGNDASGRSAASGVYFVRLESAGVGQVAKLMLVR